MSEKRNYEGFSAVESEQNEVLLEILSDIKLQVKRYVDLQEKRFKEEKRFKDSLRKELTQMLKSSLKKAR